ncbi:NAD-dependent epimerase/dehydratase family protein [Nocardia harenae]|uniref:NAD-dependent epimerase/dehydratase family protein n=1 Tax=Nocardia harenae TaxID=358707 RepID=UPI00083489ED|nr:NAD(P)-dependent oxidoreductase [Nocardia harenae]
MQILVTGARGKVGRHAVAAAVAAGHRVTASDIGAPSYGPPIDPAAPPYIRADLRDYGETAGLIQTVQPDVVVHTAGLPDPVHDPAHIVFGTNTMTTFNVAEAVFRCGVGRLVYTSSETATGFMSAQGGPQLPDYLPVDEEHPIRPHEPYALSKYLGEQILDALVRRSTATAVSVRPSLVLEPGEYASFVAPLQASAKKAVKPFFNQWSYVDADDLGELIVLAATANTPGHEVVYAAQPDNMLGRPLAELLELAYGDSAPPLGTLDRPDAGPESIAKARKLFGWDPKRSWRDHLPS